MYRGVSSVTSLVTNASRGTSSVTKQAAAAGMMANLRGKLHVDSASVLFPLPAEDGAVLSNLMVSRKSADHSEYKVGDRVQEWRNHVDESQLTASQLDVHREHLKAVEDGLEAYADPNTGFEVFTILSHLRRGSCCGNVCRHCPYKHENVPERYQGLKKDNTAFYS